MPLRIVAVSGSLRTPSTSTALLRAIGDAVAEGRETTLEIVELSALATDLGAAIVGGAASDPLAKALDAVTGA